jgi:hypothetical protein
MPVYIYHNTETNEFCEIVQRMNEPHEYFGKDGGESSWKRVFTSPNASIDSHVDPFSSKQFVDKTQNKKGTYGDLLDRSAELSAKRSEIIGGIDPVKQKYYENYSKTRKGAVHQDLKQTFESKHISVDYTSK